MKDVLFSKVYDAVFFINFKLLLLFLFGKFCDHLPLIVKLSALVIDLSNQRIYLSTNI